MKILHLFPYLPTPPTFGGALRVYHILKQLSKYHDVTVAGYNEHGDMKLFKDEFPELEGKMHFISRKHVKYRRLMQAYSYFTSHSYWYLRTQSKQFEAKLNNLLAKEDFDIVQAEYASMGHFELETDAIRILDAHKVEYDNFRSMSKLETSRIRKKFYKREYERSYLEEVKAFKRHDAIFVTSGRDGAIIKRDAPEVTQFIVPNGVDIRYFRSSGVEPEPYSIVFTGALGYLPNYDGMIYFLKEIFPVIKRFVPQAKVYIVGSKPPPALQKYQSNSVVITGFVDDVRPFIDQASVFIVPIKMGSGTRLKVVEALSMQKPVVSTSIGCEGIDATDGEDIIIRDDPTAFAEAVIRLFNDRNLRQQLVANGFELVKKKYDWTVIGELMEKAYSELTNKALLVK